MTQWQKSSFSSGMDGSNCVEVAWGGGGVLLRESDDAERILFVAPDALGGLIRDVRHRLPSRECDGAWLGSGVGLSASVGEVVADEQRGGVGVAEDLLALTESGLVQGDCLV